MAQFVMEIAGVDGDQHHTGRQGTQHHHGAVDATASHDGQAIPAFQAQRAQLASHQASAILQVQRAQPVATGSVTEASGEGNTSQVRHG